MKLSIKSKTKKPKTNQLSTGLRLLNLPLTGSTRRGLKKGIGVLLVGDSSTGKTWLLMQLLAEAAKNRAFDKYQFRFNNAENGMLIDVVKYYGKEVNRRLETTSSESLEEFYYDIDDTLKKGPCIYLTDSMDALLSKDDEGKFQEEKEASRKGNKVKGSYNMSKAKKNSQNLPRIVTNLKKTGSILVIVSQTRDNVGFGAMFNPKTRSGGKAMKFYAHVELWTSIVKTLKKKLHDKERKIGAIVKFDIQKNRLSGWEGSIEIPFIKNYGFDDIGSCISFLVEEKHWSENKNVINAKDFSLKCKREALINRIENNIKMEKKLYKIVKRVWDEVEEESKPKRKSKYE